MVFGFPDKRTGDFPLVLKYNAKAGRIYRVDRTNTGAGWETNEVDISDKFSGVFDFENIQVGWAYFSPTGPQWVMSVYGKEPLPSQPEDRGEDGKLLFKQGFKLKMLLPKALGGSVREFAATASGVVQSVGDLYEQYAAAPERAAGKLPVVKLASVTPEKGSYGTNYRPNWDIVSWVDRPDKLQMNGAAEPEEAPVFQKSAPPSTGNKTVAAPAPWENEDEDDIPAAVKKLSKGGVASQFKAAVEADADGDFG